MKIFRPLFLATIIIAVTITVLTCAAGTLGATELLSADDYSTDDNLTAPTEKTGDGLLLELPEATSPPSSKTLTDKKDTTQADERRIGLLMQYYNRCMDIIYTDLSLKDQKGYCACTAEQIHTKLSESELITLATGSGRTVDQEIMALEIEAPCLQYPAQDILYRQCRLTTRANFFRTQKGLEAYCHCWGKKAFPFFEAYGADIAAVAYDRTNPPDDLLAAIQKTQAYKKEFTNWRKTCLQNYAYN